MLYSKTTALRKIQALRKRLRCVQGGTSAGKSIAILLLLIQAAQTDETPTLTSVVSESFPHLKRGVMRDFLAIMQTHEYFDPSAWNMTDFIYTFPTGSKIEFFSADQPSKVRGPRRDRLFINEANNVPFEAFDQLEVRTKDYIFMDWNPVNEFWYHEHIQGKRDDYELLIVTYKDNEALDAQIVASIEQRKDNKNWWLVYGLGQLVFSEAQIFKGWEIVDKIPDEARIMRYGLDFGFTCLVGETMVQTSEGLKRIDQIKEGDLVLTRSGFRHVLAAWDNGQKEVFEVDFGHGRRIIATGDHKIFTGDGWKKISDLSEEETICLLNVSNSMGEFIKDTPTENTQITFISKKCDWGSSKQESCIGTSTKKTLGQSLKDFTSIMLTGTREIMNRAILYAYRLLSIFLRITTSFVPVSLPFQKKNSRKFIDDLGSGKTTGMPVDLSLCKQQEKGSRDAQNARQGLFQRMFIRNFVDHVVEKKQTHDRVHLNTSVRIAEESSERLPTIRATHVLKNARIRLRRLSEKRRVFDLTVEGSHEFFANGVLVHNCDPSTLVACYKYNGGFLFDERFYEKGLHNRIIASRIKEQPERALVIADSAEPKSIDEIRGYGINIVGCRKGPGSVNQRIQYLQDQKVYITKQSTNVIRDYRNYLWKSDRDGKMMNEPEHAFSHGTDACMYALDDFRETPQVSVKRIISNPYIRR